MNRPVSLHKLGYLLDLPADWLKAQADAGRIPCLRVGRRYLFNLAAVQEALATEAAGTRQGGSDDES